MNMNMLKKIFLSLSFAVVFMLSTTTVFATELDSRQVETVKPQEIETPDSTQETILELQNGNYEAGVYYFAQTYSNNSDSIDIAGYVDKYFFESSAREPLSLQMSCDTISMTATCVDKSQTDNLIVEIIDITHNGLHDTSFSFPANGNVRTFQWFLPEGLYEIFILGNADIEKEAGYVIFSRFE